MRQDSKLIDEELTGETIGGFYTVYNVLGYGFWESVYANALTLELTKRGLLVEREVLAQVYYEGQPIAQFRLDMVEAEGKDAFLILLFPSNPIHPCDEFAVAG